ASQSAVKRRKDSINLDRRTLAILRAALSCAFRSKHRDAQVPDFIVDLAKGGFGKFVRRCEGFLEANHAGERAIDLIAGQTAEDAMDVLDLWNAMANHGEIVSGRNRETNRVLEAVSIENRAHVEIVRHGETIEAEFFAKQLGNDAARQGRGSLLRLKTGVPTVANHHTVDGGRFRRIAPTYKLSEHGEFFAIQFLAGAIDFWQLVVRIT